MVEDGSPQLREVMAALTPHAGHAQVVGITGSPGVGKSTMTNALVTELRKADKRVGVLAVDPSSPFSGGALLGDRVRMQDHATDEGVYIRSMASRGHLGGLSWTTPQALRVLDAAGFDVVIVETVGVGQSETAVAGMTDCFALLQLPNAGDDLQAIKRGVMELADLVAINKADLDEAAATRAQAQITSSLRLMQQRTLTPQQQALHWMPRVLKLSAVTGAGVEEFWRAAHELRVLRQTSGRLAERRREQDEAWMWERIDALLHQRFRDHAGVAAALPALTIDVRAGRVAASVAARRLIDLLN
jgi:LAO/AO transport system kinase